MQNIDDLKWFLSQCHNVSFIDLFWFIKKKKKKKRLNMKVIKTLLFV